MLVRLSMRLQCRAICVNERFISVGRGVNGRRGILAARNLIPLAAARWLREPQAYIAPYLLPGAGVAVMRFCQTATTTTTDPQPEECRRMLSDVNAIIRAKGKFEMPLTHIRAVHALRSRNSTNCFPYALKFSASFSCL